jgi:hypothetical protein
MLYLFLNIILYRACKFPTSKFLPVAKPIEQKKANDEFEFATDWSRNYVEIFTKLRWLNAYARINYIAAQKSL